MVSSDDENYFDSDNGTVTDLDGSMWESAYCVLSDDGSAADLDVDMLDIEDCDNSDVWSVTDFSSCSSDVGEEDDSFSDIEPDVCDVPDVLPVRREMPAVESLCFPVVVPTRPQGGCDPVLPLPIFRGRDFLVVDDPEVIVSGRESKVAKSDVSREICMEPDLLPDVMSTDDLEPPAVSVVAQTRPRVGRGPDLPLLLVPEDGLEVILSGRESTVGMSDVSRGIYMEPNLLPIMAVPVVALMRSRVEGPVVVGQPVNVDAISRAVVYPDLLSGQVMKSVDPDVRSGDPMSLKTILGADRDARHSEWREMVLDDVVMEKFVLVPEVCPVGSMTSAAELTFLPALSEVYSPVFRFRKRP